MGPSPRRFELGARALALESERRALRQGRGSAPATPGNRRAISPVGERAGATEVEAPEMGTARYFTGGRAGVGEDRGPWVRGFRPVT